MRFIDTNHDGVISAQEVQNFVDGAAAAGKPEAGAMAALLGGTATYAAAGVAIAVSKPLRALVATGASVVAPAPARTRQLVVRVSPFQLA